MLKEIHDELDAAVAEAYGWPVDLADEEILERLVALNHERAEEEKRGLVRWLRPEYQNPGGATQTAAALTDKQAKPKRAAKAKAKKRPWPAKMAEQAAAVQGALERLADGRCVAARVWIGTGEIAGSERFTPPLAPPHRGEGDKGRQGLHAGEEGPRR